VTIDECGALVVVDHVVGRRGHRLEVVGGVANARKRGEARYRAILTE
jgi:hypothetical protein